MQDDELWDVDRVEHSAEMAARVRQAAAWATDADGVSPLNEQAHRILEGRLPGEHWVGIEGDELIGYAQLDPDTASVQLFVAPGHRHQGVGRMLAEEINAENPDLSWWSFGTLPAAQKLANCLGLSPQRELLKMALDPSRTPLPPAGPAPEGIVVESFTPDAIDELVSVNARAFAHHPEQGAMSRADVEEKMTAPWFDPEGLLIAVDESDTMLGFHWTKITEEHRSGSGRQRVGEVYVIGVLPEAAGRGLGRHLLEAGLSHLADQDVDRVELFVEGDAERVVRMYRRAGFEVVLRDTLWGA